MATQAGARSSDALTVTTVSNPRPQLVSGADVLLRVGLPDGARPDDVKVLVNGQDVTAAFTATDDGDLLGMATGLRDGANRVTALPDHGARFRPAGLTVVNRPSTGPVFSGTQQQPFVCRTEAFGLGPATGPGCSAATKVTYSYRTTAGELRPLADPAAVPADAASVTVDGRTVPYVVRVERGVVDRAVYEIAAIYDGRDPSPAPGRDEAGWNGRLVYTFGGGCNAGYHQG
nr:DUF6351 family protein [Micromonospora sp. DSM 115978]